MISSPVDLNGLELLLAMAPVGQPRPCPVLAWEGPRAAHNKIKDFVEIRAAFVQHRENPGTSNLVDG